MRMEKVSLDGIEINFARTEGKKPQIVFLHGNSSSLSSFDKQLQDKDLLSSYQLIALDLPGHGSSGRDDRASQDASIYTIPYYARMIESFLTELEVHQPLLVGHSLGGHIGIHLSHLIPLSGFLSFQAPPLDKAEDAFTAFNPLPELSQLFVGEITDSHLEGLIDQFLFIKGDEKQVETDFKNTDPLCRANMGASLGPGVLLQEKMYWESLKKPKAFLFSDRDPMLNEFYLEQNLVQGLWNEKPFKIKQAGHYPHIEQPEEFNSVLKSFAQDVFSAL